MEEMLRRKAMSPEEREEVDARVIEELRATVVALRENEAALKVRLAEAEKRLDHEAKEGGKRTADTPSPSADAASGGPDDGLDGFGARLG